MRHSIFFVALIAATQMGCGAKLPSVKPFKMEIQQGNVVTSKMLLQLRPGMTRSQVRYIMGTPLVVDSFRSNRWDYFYELRKQGVVVEKRRVILDFDQDNLVSVRGDVIPTADNAEVKTLAELPKVVVDESKHWSEKLMFWKEEAATDTLKPLAENPTAESTQAAITPMATGQSQPATATTQNSPPPVEDVANTTPAPMPAEAPTVAAVETLEATTKTAEAQVIEKPVVAKPVEEKLTVAKNALPSETNANATATAATAVATSQPVMNSQAATNQLTTPPQAAKSQPSNEATVQPVLPTQVSPAPVAPAPAPAVTVAQAQSTAQNAPETKASPAPAASITRPVQTAKPILYQAPRAMVNEAATPKAAQLPKAAATPIVKTVPAEAMAATAEEDEIVPFIPEGEYQGPGPTLEEMQLGNAQELVTPVTDAATQTVTEKGVAPAVSAQEEAVFVAEQLPDTSPEAAPTEATINAPQAAVAPPVVSAATIAREKAEKAQQALDKLAALKAELAKMEAAKAEKANAQAAKTTVDSVAMDQASTDKKAAKQATAATPVLAPPATSAPTSDVPVANSESQLQADLAMWAQAWRSKKIASYLGAYATDFVPEGAMTKSAWEAQRRQRLAAPGEIRLVLKNVAVNITGALATVQFEQDYAAKTYRDKTSKTLNMRFDPAKGHWLITREFSSPLLADGLPASAAPVVPVAATLPSSATDAVVAEGAANAAKAPDVTVAVQAWAQAWARKDLSAYLAAYAPEFVPEGLPSRQAWVNQRKARLSPKQGPISVEISNLAVELMDKQAKVQFLQKYSAKSYRDEMQKTLLLRLDATANTWLIVKETATQETAKKAVTAPEGSAEQLDGVLEQIGF